MTAKYRAIAALEDHHLPQLMDLYKSAWWSQTRTVDQVRRLLEWSDVVIGLVSDPGERLVAFARVLTDRTFRAMVFDVIVAADCRGLGVGHQLMEAVLSHPAIKDVEYVELYCRPDLVPFYERLGFAAPGSGVVLMRRSPLPTAHCRLPTGDSTFGQAP